MPVFPTRFRTAWARMRDAQNTEFVAIFTLPTAQELAVDLFGAFNTGGRRDALTEHELIGRLLARHEFSSRGQRSMCYRKLVAPVRDALQVLEHAELVRCRVRTDRPDTWHITAKGRQTLLDGPPQL